MVFPKARRLTSNQQFKSVLDRGRRAGNGLPHAASPWGRPPLAHPFASLYNSPSEGR